MRHRIVLCLTLLCGAICGPTAAQGAGAKRAQLDAASAFHGAVSLYDAGQYEDALALFRHAYRQSKSPNARLYIARCLGDLGRYAAAYEEMRGTVRLAARLADTQSKYVPTRDAAIAELAILEGKIGKVVLGVVNPPAGMRVHFGERAIDTRRLGAPVVVMPGSLEVFLTAPGKKDIVRTIRVREGKTERLDIEFEGAHEPAIAAARPLEAIPEKAGPESDETEPAGGSSATVRNAGIVTAVLGGVSLGVFAITASVAQSKFDDIDEACGSKPCGPEYGDVIDEGRAFQGAANASLVIGSALTLGGVAMIIFGGPAAEESASLGFVVRGAEGGSLQLKGRF